MKRVILLAVAAGFLAACADSALDAARDKAEWQERTYRTGSNIPSKHSDMVDGVQTVNKDDVDRIRNGSSGQLPIQQPRGASSGG